MDDGGGKAVRGVGPVDRETGLRAGHSPDQLKVGIHSLGYVADSASKAANDFFPGYARSFSEIGRERGWPPVTRAHFDALLAPTGALIVGDPETVAAKILRVNESLGGISRLTFQMSVAALPHAKLMHAIELLGTRVAPLVRIELGAGTAEVPLDETRVEFDEDRIDRIANDVREEAHLNARRATQSKYE